MKRRETIGTNGVGSIFASGTAYICIPDNIDRDTFIKRCFKTQTVFLRGEYGESFKNVFISKSSIREVEFPETSKERGSMVAWIKQPKHNVPIVVGVFDLKNVLPYIDQERQVRFQKRSKSGNIVDLNGLADLASFEMNVSSAENDKGVIKLKVNNPNNTAKLDLYVSGTTNLFCSGQIKLSTNDEFLVELVKDDGSTLATLSYKKGVGLSLKDEYNNEIVTKSKSVYLKEGSSGGRQLEVTDKKINLGTIGGAAEPVLLGNKTETVFDDIVDMLQKIITLLSQISAQDAAGVATILNSLGATLNYPVLMGATGSQLAGDLNTLISDIAQIKSSKTNTD